MANGFTAEKAELNNKLQAIAVKMSDIEQKDKKTDADIEAYKSLVADGTKLRGQMDVLLQGEAFKAWANAPDGQSAFKQGMTQEVTSPADRDQEQRAQDVAHKSAYKSAFEAYLSRRPERISTKDWELLHRGAIKANGTKAGITETVDSGGGFTVPEDFQAEVLKKSPGLLGLVDIVRRVPTTRDILVFPKISYTTDNKYTAPHRLTWTGETPSSATVHNVTDQTFGQARIPVNVAMASQLLSNSLIEDSATNVLQMTADLFRENIEQDVEFYVAQGTGAGQPEGITVNATAQTNYVPSLFATTIGIDGWKDIYYKTPAQYRKNGKWVMSSDTARLIAELKDANNRYLWSDADQFGAGLTATQYDGVQVRQPALLGAPVAFSEQMPSVAGNAFPVSFGDHRGYIIADRVGMSVQVLRELYAETDRVLYLLRLRMGGQLAEDYKIKLYKIAAS